MWHVVKQLRILIVLLLLATVAYFIVRDVVIDPNTDTPQIDVQQEDEESSKGTLLKAYQKSKTPLPPYELNLLQDISLLVLRLTQFSDKLFNAQFVESQEIIDGVNLLTIASKLTPDEKALSQKLRLYKTAIAEGAFDEVAPLNASQMRTMAPEAMIFYRQEAFTFYTLMLNELIKDLTQYQLAIEKGITAVDAIERQQAYIEEYTHRIALNVERIQRANDEIADAYTWLTLLWQKQLESDCVIEIETALFNAKENIDQIEKEAQFIESQSAQKTPELAEYAQVKYQSQQLLNSLTNILPLTHQLAICVSKAVLSYKRFASALITSGVPEIYPAENLAALNQKMVERCKTLTQNINNPMLKHVMNKETKVSSFLESWAQFSEQNDKLLQRYAFLDEQLKRIQKEDISPAPLPENLTFPQRSLKKFKRVFRIFDQSTMQPIEQPILSIEKDEKISFKKIPSSHHFYTLFLASPTPYVLSVKAEGFNSKKFAIRVLENARPEVIENIYLEPEKIQEEPFSVPLRLDKTPETRLKEELLTLRKLRLKHRNNEQLRAENEHIYKLRCQSIRTGHEPRIEYQ